MWLSDSLQFIQQFLDDVSKTSFFIFVFLLNYNHFLFLNFNIHLFLNLDELRECYPLIDVFQVLFDNDYQIFEIGLSSYIRSK